MSKLYDEYLRISAINPFAAGFMLGAKCVGINGVTGKVFEIHYKALLQNRYDSISILWDNGNLSAYCFLENLLIDNRVKFIVNKDKINRFNSAMGTPPPEANGCIANGFNVRFLIDNSEF